MKYLSLDEKEIKELKNLLKGSISSYLIVLSLVLLIFYVFSGVILKGALFHDAYPHLIAFLISNGFLFYLFYNNRNYTKDLRNKKKKVYTGVLSEKAETGDKKKSYYFYMDGNKFSVELEDFENFQEGDIIEFHISQHSRRILKIQKGR